VTATPSHNVFLLYFRHLDDFFTTVSEMEDNVFVWQSTIETTVPLCFSEGSAYDILINTKRTAKAFLWVAQTIL
jgi:hypothetical protein